MQLAQQAACIVAPFWACQDQSDGEPGHKSGTKSRIFAEPAPLHIVVVEDEPFVRLDIEAVLTAAGHDVVAAADTAEDAIAIAELERPDLMIMDVRLLEGGDGVKAAIEIWERFGIRSLFASANLDPIMRAQAGRANPVGFVDKPFLTATLLAALPKKA
ncbi:MAG TPA: response regulator [Hyphomicrobiales bacterium]